MKIDNYNESDLFNDVYRDICSELGLDAAIAVYQMYKGQQIKLKYYISKK